MIVRAPTWLHCGETAILRRLHHDLFDGETALAGSPDDSERPPCKPQIATTALMGLALHLGDANSNGKTKFITRQSSKPTPKLARAPPGPSTDILRISCSVPTKLVNQFKDFF
jgi:hypothetical protein